MKVVWSYQQVSAAAHILRFGGCHSAKMAFVLAGSRVATPWFYYVSRKISILKLELLRISLDLGSLSPHMGLRVNFQCISNMASHLPLRRILSH